MGTIEIHAFETLSGTALLARAPRELTSSEREVATMALAGLANRAIAEARSSSVRTVANLLARVFRKLGVRSRGELAALAFTPGGEPAAGLERLSAREREVLGWIAKGATNKFAAYELGVAEASVASYLRRAALKLGVRTRVELVRLYNGARVENA
jgi:DNA-binding NarL/FixJ family response regulator